MTDLAYGENAWQTPARLVTEPTQDPLAIGAFEQLEGAPLSFNNVAEVDRQLQTITHIAAALPGRPAAIGTKHGNACGAAVGDDAVARMLDGDLRAIFGGCVMLNVPVDAAVGDTLLRHATDHRRLLDLVTAPAFTDEAIEMLARKHGKCRLLANPALGALDRSSLDTGVRVRPVRGGRLEQPQPAFVPEHPELDDDMLLGWAVGSTSDSNTITLVRDGQLLANGVGQQDRVGGCELAIARARMAGHDPAGSVAYSDSFFPFDDGPKLLIEAGVRAIFATSGSVRDDEVRTTIEAAGVAFVTLPDREARGFFGH